MMGASLDDRRGLLLLSFSVLLLTKHYNSCFGVNVALGKVGFLLSGIKSKHYVLYVFISGT